MLNHGFPKKYVNKGGIEMCSHRVNKEDISIADKEYDSVMNCIVLVEIHLEKSNFDLALGYIRDIEKSLKVLKRLIEKNHTDSRVIGIVNRLKEVGVDQTTLINAIKKAK